MRKANQLLSVNAHFLVAGMETFFFAEGDQKNQMRKANQLLSVNARFLVAGLEMFFLPKATKITKCAKPPDF
jgi:hypothetical protein